MQFSKFQTQHFLLDPHLYYAKREFSFTLKDDVYIRYLSFADREEMEKEILKREPYKIDIGAVFSLKVNLICYAS